MKRLHLASALFVLGLVGQQAWSGTYPPDVPSLGYSPQNMDTSVDPRQDFYRNAAGNWLRKTEIAPSDPDVGGFTLLAHQLDTQLLTLIKEAAADTGAPKGSPRQQVGDFCKAAMDSARRAALGLQPLAADLDHVQGDDARLLAYAYAFEQATNLRVQPELR